MKGFLFAACCIGILIYTNGCYKSDVPNYWNCTPVPVANDSTALLQFAMEHHIKATKDSSGLYYEITNAGSGPCPSLTSTIYVTYIGKLMNGTTFDSVGNSAYTGWALNTLLDGWQIAVPKLYTGGHIKLLLPSALAYKCAGTGDGRVPVDAPLYYEITLVSFK
ncbi:MAG: FKBP-type peptidyl-prolyl cis-trans isomerase [Bacteroidetes bacterium]|nr:FKBP-type peptidyl-prolyl cis-trans isomerase [Bacteroidota bacterium]